MLSENLGHLSESPCHYQPSQITNQRLHLGSRALRHLAGPITNGDFSSCTLRASSRAPAAGAGTRHIRPFCLGSPLNFQKQTTSSGSQAPGKSHSGRAGFQPRPLRGPGEAPPFLRAAKSRLGHLPKVTEGAGLTSESRAHAPAAAIPRTLLAQVPPWAERTGCPGARRPPGPPSVGTPPSRAPSARLGQGKAPRSPPCPAPGRPLTLPRTRTAGPAGAGRRHRW